MKDYKDLVNCILISLFLSLSITSHLIAYRFVDLMGWVVIPSSLTYMACFVIVDVLSTFNNRIMLVAIMFCEAAANLIMMVVTNIVIELPSPSFLSADKSFHDVFKPIGTMYWANLVGAFISLFVNYYIFTILYIRYGVGFVISSVVSSVVVIFVYTSITDYLAFYKMYPEQAFEITMTNIITNVFFLILFSIPAKHVVSILGKYNRREYD